MRKLLTVTGIVGMLLTSSVALSDDAAIVLNTGRDGLMCILITAFTGTGDATLVTNHAGKVMVACNGLVNEAPPARALRSNVGGPLGTSCKLTITPAGSFHATCHN